MDWYSRYVVSWRMSNTLDADFCVEAFKETLGKGTSEVFNTCQGGRFTGEAFSGVLKQNGVKISMDGKGHLKAYSSGREAKAGLDAYFFFYNNQRPHQALGYRTPAEAFNGDSGPSTEPQKETRRSPTGASVIEGKTAGLSLSFAPNLSN